MLQRAQYAVKEFMVKAEQDTPATPAVPDDATRLLRISLIREELNELMKASQVYVVYTWDGTLYTENRQPKPNITEAADAIADLLVVVLGAAVAWGIDISPVFMEVMRSNMTKFEDGYRRNDGKWMKGPSWQPPDIASILAAQMD